MNYRKFQTRRSNIKFHYACFACRKSFKHKPVIDGETLTYNCPDCGAELCNMGPDLKAPKKHDFKQWKKVILLAKNGVCFYSYSGNPGPFPKNIGEVPRFLDERRLKLRTGGKILLDKIKNSQCRAR